MLSRTLLLALLGWLVWMMVRRSAKRPEVSRSTTMRQCAHCGLHVPDHETTPGNGAVFCSEAHRHAHETQRTP